jgi:phosphatidylglycerol:prolipoprotein diacylglycerol transferase
VRPRIVDYFLGLTGLDSINYLIPTGLTIYFLAVSAVFMVFYSRCRKAGLPEKHIILAGVIAIISGIIGVRLFSVLENLIVFGTKQNVVFSLGGSTTSWGAYTFGSAAFCFYLAYHKQPILKYADILGASLGLGPFIGRWACFFNGCCYGKVTDLFWAVRYPQYSPAHNAHWKAGLIDLETQLSLAVHPVQLYASFSALFIFFLISKIYQRYANKPGMTIAFYGLLYGLFRFFVEFFRDDVPRHTIFALTLGQFICIVLFILFIGAIWLLVRRGSGGLNR